MRVSETDSHIQELFSQYNAGLKRKRNIGLKLIGVAVICAILGIAANMFSDILGIAILGIAFVIFVAGLLTTMYYSMSADIIKVGIGVISLLKEPKLDPDHGLVYAIIDDVYLIVTRRSAVLCVISFWGTPQPTDKESLKIPQSFFDWSKKTKVGNIKMFRKEGVYRVPSPDGGFVEGEGVVYAQKIIPSDILDVIPKYTKELLLEIIETIKQETKVG